MRILLLAAACWLVVTPPAIGCTIAGNEPFVPDVAGFEPKYDKDENIALLPQPTPRLLRVQRGSAAAGASCDDAGIIELELTWSSSSEYKIGEVGFYFRVVSGKSPDEIFPLEPTVGRVVGERMRFVFAWLDGHPSRQLPLDLRVEVFAVNRGLQIGPSVYFLVKSSRG